MSRSTLVQISPQPDGAYVAVWGRYLLRSAYQPILSLKSDPMDVAAFEGLLRPFEAERAATPAEFFGSIAAKDRHAVEALTRTLHVLNAPRHVGSDALLFINFDPSVLIDRAITDIALRDLRLALHQAGIEPGRVVCELTEARSGSEEALHEFVRALKAHGFQIAIDDFGADESDLSRVKVLQPHVVKFDGGWMAELADTSAGVGLLASLVERFHAAGVTTVFEGIEETSQLDVARHCGADLAQGFALARPTLEPTATDIIPDDGLNSGARSDEKLEARQPPEIAASVMTMTRAARPFGKRGFA